MGNLATLEQVTLAWVTSDYETVDSILGNVVEEMGTAVAPADVFRTLAGLHKQGLVDAHLCEATAQRYIRTSSPATHDMTIGAAAETVRTRVHALRAQQPGATLVRFVRYKERCAP
jgi:hypothetical protein